MLHKGQRQAGGIAVMDADTYWEVISMSLLDAEFLAQRRFSVEEICRWFGVPPQMIASQEKPTFASYEQAGLNFLGQAVLPQLVRLEQEVNRKLFARAIAGRQQPYVKLNTAAIVRVNLEARHRAMALGRQWGWLSANDCRRLLDMAPIGPEGDVYLTPMNMEPAPDEDAGEGETQSETVRRVEQLRRA